MSDCWPGEGGLQDGAAGEGTAANTSQVRSYHLRNSPDSTDLTDPPDSTDSTDT